VHGIVAIRLVRLRLPASGPLDRERVKVAAIRIEECTITQTAETVRMILRILLMLLMLLMRV
jgi:hypothetical protein